ncbi:class I adenylate-forming enzyme family protein [Sphingomonas jaspsi]|uniref:class I adenylate-forming enzyme family protein n=1 Tax=Sphingomonas jaspsi TaxID=392409 RepID=UPI0004B009C7|nr:class I adenylate-forming enzyme family protein [Sphingomonas jaspsi]
MPSVLDQQYEAVLAAMTAPGGPLVIEKDAMGRAYVANFPQTLPTFFQAFSAMHAAVECIVDGEQRLTFAEANALSDRIARALVKRGVHKGDRVAIAMRNCAAWILSYMAVAKVGAVATLINGWWREAELDHALRLTEPSLIIADGPRAQLVDSLEGGWKVEPIDIRKPAEEAFAALITVVGDATPLPEIVPDDDATILFTSGSTGLAKGALSTHRQVMAATYTYVTSLLVLKGILEHKGTPPVHPLRALVSVPLFHVTGEIPVMLTSMAIGRTLVLMPKWDAGEAIRLIEREKITAFTGVPTMALEILNHPDRANHDLSTLADINSGGAPRPASHVERQERDMPTTRSVQGYGLTETNAVGCGIFWSNYKEKPTSTGRPQIPYVELAILGADGSHLPQGETGEIAIRAAGVIKGYFRDPAATEAAFTSDGYFRTGDVGYIDPDGYLFIVDRMKEIIIRGGENISAAEVEAAIYGCDGVAEAAVFGIADDRLGEVPAAILYRRDGSTLSEEQLRDFLGARLAAFKMPAKFIFASEPLPRLGTGKIDRVALKQRYAA